MESITKIATLVCLLATTTLNAQIFQWAKALGANSEDVATSIAVDPWGNVVTAGYFSGIVDFDPGPETSYLIAKGEIDIFVQKMDASGNFLWARSFGGNADSEYCTSISVDASGNVYTTGYFNGTVDFHPAAVVLDITSAGSGQNTFVHKMNSQGLFQWVKTFGAYTFFNDFAPAIGSSISVDASGNVYTTGSFQGTVDFNPGLGTANFTAKGQDIFIQKMDASGNFLWAKTFGGSSLNNSSNSNSIDASGNVYTTGSFSGTVDFNPGAGTANLTSKGDTDIFVQKMDASGNFIWAKTFGGSSVDNGTSINVDVSGNVYTTGSFSGTVDFNPGAGTANLTSKGDTDIFVQKMDASGNFIWAKAFGGSSVDNGTSINVDVSGNVYTTGNFYGWVDFDPNAGTAILTALGPSDIFVQKMDASGNFLWAKSFGGGFGSEGSSIVDASGNIYTAGYFSATADFDPGIGAANLTSMGDNDIFVQKMSPETTTNILELTNEIHLMAFPNPSSGLVKISSDKSLSDVVVNVIDMQGKIIYSKLFDSFSNEQLQIIGPVGIYFLRVITPNGESVVKLIKK